MTYLMIVLALSFALAMDAFAVSISLGTAGLAKHFGNRIKIAISFGFFQGFLFFLGYVSIQLIGKSFSQYNQYIASALLLFLGIKMCIEGLKKEEDNCPHNICLGLGCENKKCDRTGQYRFLDYKLLFIFGIATSIDAFAAGISYALQYSYSYMIVYYVGGITLVLSFFGAAFGHKLKETVGRRSDLIGGIILIILALKTFI